MNVSASALLVSAGKLGWREVEKWAKAKSKPLGEWRGELKFEAGEGGECRVFQPDDPCRLWIPAVGLEYAWADGGWRSDGASIPAWACRVLHCARDDFRRSGFLHDFSYETEGVYARNPDADLRWTRIAVDKDTADTLLRVGVTAEGATNAQAEAIWLGVRTPFGEAAWRRCRERCCG